MFELPFKHPQVKTEISGPWFYFSNNKLFLEVKQHGNKESNKARAGGKG